MTVPRKSENSMRKGPTVLVRIGQGAKLLLDKRRARKIPDYVEVLGGSLRA